MGTSMMTQLFGEFFGTMILVLLGDGVCAAVNLKKSKAFASGWVVIALGWGAAVTLAVYMSGFTLYRSSSPRRFYWWFSCLVSLFTPLEHYRRQRCYFRNLRHWSSCP